MRFPSKRSLVVIGVVLLCSYAVFLLFINWAMRQPPETFGRVMAKMPMPAYFVIPFETFWTRARAGALRTGEEAPDFRLPTLDHQREVQLSSFREKQPVVLVFGSYTWPPFRREVPALNKLYEQYGSRVAFYAVYIQEAHPSDVWQMRSNIRDSVVFASPKDEQERTQIAGTCVRKLGIKFPAVIDGFDNRTEVAYTGWPDRLYLIDRDGRVVFKSKPGPFGFKPAELQAALDKLTQS
jgi:peroxiredoxin